MGFLERLRYNNRELVCFKLFLTGKWSGIMPMPKKIISLTTTSAFHGVGGTRLPTFPRDMKDFGTYLQAINPVIDVGIVTKSSQEELKMNKLRLIIAFLNLYRLIETFSVGDMRPVVDALKKSDTIGSKLLNLLDFCTMSKLHYEREDNLTKKFSMAITLFDDGMFLNPTQAAVTIDSFLSQYPSNGDTTDKPRIEKHRTWSGNDASDGNVSFSVGAKEVQDAAGLSTLHIEDIEAAYESRNSNLGDSSRSGSEHSKESDPSSQGREDFVSLTSATLRRTLKNYWRAKEIGVVVQDEILCSLWDKSIVGKACSAEHLKQAIAFFPLELAFLWDRETQVVTAFDIGKSHAIEIRDLTEVEKVRHTVIIHNHPHGDTFSLEDLVLCSNKGAKEV